MPIQAPGVGSGLDVNSIVTQLMEIEREPINRLERKETIVNAQISAYGSLTSKLSTFQDAMKKLSSASEFQVFTALSNDEELFSVTADSEAIAGSYTVDVVGLAERDKIATKAYANSTSTVGEGSLTLSVGGNSFSITIDDSNNTVSGLRDAINDATDNTGVSASIVTDDAGAHLVLSSDQTGVENALTITTTDSDGNSTDDVGLSSLAYDVAGGVVHRAAISTAVDAVVKIDGFTITSASNVIDGALEGVAVTAKAIGSSTINIARDDEKITAAVQEFADSYNALRTEMVDQRKGQLEADSTLLTIERQMSAILNSGDSITGSQYSYLAQVGLSLDEFGKMNVDTDILTKVLNTDFSSFVNLFSAEDEGIAARLESLAGSLVGDDGLIDARETGLQTQLESIEDQKIRIEGRLVSIERRIRAQFAALDILVSNLSSTGDFLTQQLASMPVVNRS